MRDHKKIRGSFFSLLLRNYLGFTLAIAVAAGLIFTLANMDFNQRMQGLDGTDMQKYLPALQAGRYTRFPTRRLLGRKGYIQVVDSAGRTVYKTTGAPDNPFTPQQIACVPAYQKNTYIAVTEQEAVDGQSYIMVTRNSLYEANYAAQEVALFDDWHNLVYGQLPGGAVWLDETSFALFTQTGPGEHTLWRYPFTGSDGRHYDLLMYAAYFDEAEYEYLTAIWWRDISSFLVVYVLVILVLVFWLDRKVNKPLGMLGRAMDQLAAGHTGEPLQYRGPREFEQICQDFNSLQARLQESERQRARLEGEKQKMLADISHDLKTPITVIQGYAKAISDGLIPAEKRDQYLRTIYQKSDALAGLIATFYEYSKLDHPDFAPQLRRQDLCELVREYLAGKYTEIELAGFALEVELPETPLYCMLDAAAMGRVFDNIVGNALRHNPAGTAITFLLRQAGTGAELMIADNGVGIPPEIAADIFAPFVVGDESRNSRQGSGLGLSIAKKIAVAHGGDIALFYPPQAGFSTQFVMTLPLAKHL